MAPDVQDCRMQVVHDPHHHVKAGVLLYCVGVPCDHDNRCCAEHQVHVMPHRGCVLR